MTSCMFTHPNSVHRTRTSLGWHGCQAQRPGRVPRTSQPADPPTAPMSCAAGSRGSLPTGHLSVYAHPAGAVVALTQQSLAARVTSALGPRSEPQPHRVRARGPLLAASRLKLLELGQINIVIIEIIVVIVIIMLSLNVSTSVHGGGEGE